MPGKSANSFPIVFLGASAGTMDSFEQFVKAIPAEVLRWSKISLPAPGHEDDNHAARKAVRHQYCAVFTININPS